MKEDDYTEAWSEGDESGPAESAVKAAAQQAASDSDAEFVRAFMETDGEDEEERRKRERREEERRAAAKKADE